MRTHIDATASIYASGPPAGAEAKLSPIRVKHRITAVDAARGCAMILVCLSHIKHHFIESAPALYSAMTMTTRIATPTFLLLSGFVIGHLLRGNSHGKVGLSLVDRGLFLLLVAHFLLGLNELQALSFVSWVFGKVMITDVIGVALCIAVLIRGASTAALLSTGAVLCSMSWVIAMTLSVQSQSLQLLGSLLFHMQSAPNRLIDVALLPYLGVFLIGMGLSSYCKQALLNGESERLAGRLATIGGIAVLVVIVGIIGWHFGKNSLPASWSEPHDIALLRATLHPGSKTPPSPAYLLFYGGLGLLMTAALFANWPRWLVSGVGDKAAVIGKASLLCFIVQDWLFFLLPDVLGFAHVSSVVFWLCYFLLGVIALFLLSKQWIRIDGNRFFTVGLKRLLGRCQAMKGTQAA